VRFILAATMSSAYGVYGPPFEHVDNNQHPRREEYANNEKYEVRSWNWNDPDSLQPLMQKVNSIRRNHPALQYMRPFRLHATRNDHLLAFSKQHGDDCILVVINLDPFAPHEGLVSLPLAEMGLPTDRPFPAVDLLRNTAYTWSGSEHYVRLEPGDTPAHILSLG
jgi:starch synthase (maltosyl-transferring)